MRIILLHTPHFLDVIAGSEFITTGDFWQRMWNVMLTFAFGVCLMRQDVIRCSKCIIATYSLRFPMFLSYYSTIIVDHCMAGRIVMDIRKTSETWEILAAKNRLDIQLYEFAKELFVEQGKWMKNQNVLI